MSKLFQGTVKTSTTHYQEVIVTAQQVQNDINGNPRHALQVWVYRNDVYGVSGNLWTPKVKGYRINKNDQYIIHSYNLDRDVTYFLEEFEKAVRQD